MIRYLRLFAYFLQFSFSKALQFRIDFFFRIGMDIVFYLVNILFYEVVYSHTNLIGGWDKEQMMVFVGAFLLIDALNMTLFADNLSNISFFVNRGDLDYYLIRPVSSLFFLSLREFAASSFVNLLMACSFLTYALVRYSGPTPLPLVLLFLLLILNGTYLRYLVRMMTIIPVFWMHSNRGLEMMFYHLVRFLERPDAIFTGWVRIILTTILPFGLMVSFPSRILFGGVQWNILFHLAAVTVALSGMVFFFWRKGLRSYSSASS
jgi:ABC-2 type transport system permease protein